MSSSNDNNADDAIVFKQQSMKDQSDDDGLSVRSMPLQHDDDYFYYHGDGGKEDDVDGESVDVDHIGLLIGPAIVQKVKTTIAESEREMRDSLRSMTSEVTSDWIDYDSDAQDEIHQSTQDCIDLKLQIADLKAQLDTQKFRYKKKYDTIISTLQDRNLSLECENVGLKQKLKECQDVALRERVEARQVERLLQDKIEFKAREVKLLSQDRARNKSQRRSSSGDAEDRSNHREEDYLPFPRSRNFEQLSCSFNDVPERRPSLLTGIVGRRPSLLASLCGSFRKNSGDGVPTMISSQVSSLDSDDSEFHYSWANAEEINAETGLFNKKASAKLLLEESAKKGSPEHKDPVLRRNSMICPSQPAEPTSPRENPQRRKSFTLGERPASLKDLFSKRMEQGIDVESELWDSCDDNALDNNALDASSNSGTSDNYPMSLYTVRTSAW